MEIAPLLFEAVIAYACNVLAEYPREAPRNIASVPERILLDMTIVRHFHFEEISQPYRK